MSVEPTRIDAALTAHARKRYPDALVQRAEQRDPPGEMIRLELPDGRALKTLASTREFTMVSSRFTVRRAKVDLLLSRI